MVDLPHPDSPTSANVVPSAMANDTSSTARSHCRFSPAATRCSHGRETSKLWETPMASRTVRLVLMRVVPVYAGALPPRLYKGARLLGSPPNHWVRRADRA